MTGPTDDQPTAPVVVLPREIAPPLKLDDKEQEVGDVTPAVTKARVQIHPWKAWQNCARCSQTKVV